MNHRLIRPLIQQRGYWILPPIKDQNRGFPWIAATAYFFNEIRVPTNFLIELLCEKLTYLWSFIIPDLWILPPYRHQDWEQPVGHSIKRKVINIRPVSPGVQTHIDHWWDVKIEQMWVHGLVVHIDLLKLLDNIVDIGFRKFCKFVVLHFVWKI